MRKERLECLDSARRNDSVEQNLNRWNEMKEGTEEGLKCVLRAKIDMKSLNGALRDPSLARCLKMTHQRTGYIFVHFFLRDSLTGTNSRCIRCMISLAQ